MRVRLALGVLILLSMALPGCSRPVACELLPVEPPAEPFCALTVDGWALHGAAWNANGTRVVVLVHGLNEDHHSYDALAQELAAKGWRVVAFDSRGMGLSTNKGSFRNFTSDDFAAMDKDLDAIASVATAGRPALAGVPRESLVGASVGSSEVLRFAARAAPDAPLVLLSPGLGYQGIEVLPAARAHHAPAWLVASPGDDYAARSVPRIGDAHAGPTNQTILPSGALHGTQLLQDASFRAQLADWLDHAVPREG